MIKLLKLITLLIGLVFATAMLAAINLHVAIIFAALLAIVCIVAIIKPLPRIGLASRFESAIALLIAVGCLSATMDIKQKQFNKEPMQISATVNESVEIKATAETPIKQEGRSLGSQDAKPPKDTEQVVELVTIKESLDPQKLAMIAKTKRMADEIANAIRQNYDNVDPQSQPWSDGFCRDDGFCELIIGDFNIIVFGEGIAEVQTTTQSPHSTYREICSAVFSGIAHAKLDFAAQQMESAFNRATQVGQVKFKINNVETKVSKHLSDILGCRFFKFGD